MKIFARVLKESRDSENGNKNMKSDEDKPTGDFHLLHLSDLHISIDEQASHYFKQLELDLDNLRIEKLDYLILSGDIADRASEGEYKAALYIKDVIKKFKINKNKIIIVPGNHDVDYNITKKDEYGCYKFMNALPEDLDEEKYVKLNYGCLVRQEEIYKKRFKNFNEYFYKPITEKDYPLDYKEQATLHIDDNNKLLFLGLNSAWKIDHHYPKRVSLNKESLYEELSKIDSKYEDHLKIAVWHHPVTNVEANESIKDDFLDHLVNKGFHICMHGHIHEAKSSVHEYFKNKLSIVGAGTFSSPTKEQVSGIPWQYNLLTWDKEKECMFVRTRKKEKKDGPWRADARWDNSENPKPFYKIDLSKKMDEQ